MVIKVVRCFEKETDLKAFLGITGTFGKRFYTWNLKTDIHRVWLSIKAVAISRELIYCFQWIIDTVCDTPREVGIFSKDEIRTLNEHSNDAFAKFLASSTVDATICGIPLKKKDFELLYPCADSGNLVDVFYYNGFTQVDDITELP